MQNGVERQIAAIIRWLERFQSAYRSGALESALLDAECARADLEDLRLDIWKKVERTPQGTGRRAFRLCFSALILLLLTAAPLSVEGLRAPAPPVLSQAAIPLDKEPLSSPPPAAPGPLMERRAPTPAAKSPQRLAAARRPARGTPPVETEKKAQVVKKSVPYDKVFSLIQTGSRALKDGESVIKIKKGEGIL